MNLWAREPDIARRLYQLAVDICRDPSNGLPFDVDIAAVDTAGSG